MIIQQLFRVTNLCLVPGELTHIGVEIHTLRLSGLDSKTLYQCIGHFEIS